MGERILMMPGNNTTTTPSSSNSSSSSAGNTARAMERPPGATQDHHQSGPLKCPRCDSTNTKFCYYNNYSLSQPRHFCKACKRYWTRGGTLRNVPVGGGCRKNKRVKKTPSASAPALAPPPLSLPITSQIDVRPADLNPFFYDMSNLTFPALRHRLDPTPTCGVQNGSISLPCTTYDLLPQLDALGLGFPPSHHQNNEEYQSGFGTNLSQLQQSAAVSSAASLLHDYPLFGSALISSLKQPKKVEDYETLFHYEDLQASANGNLGMLKEVKVEGEANATGGNWINWEVPCENPFEAMTAAAAAASNGPGDSSFLYWNAGIGAAAWPDATNYGSSVAPMI